MNWTLLEKDNQLDQLVELSQSLPILIFKHSTRCSISLMAKRGFENEWNYPADKVQPFFLDLIAFRSISNAIAERFSVMHQSPQILLIKNGSCIFSSTHSDIDAASLKDYL